MTPWSVGQASSLPVTRASLPAVAGNRPDATSQLPDGWRWVKLGEFCEERTGVRDPRREPDQTFRYVDIASVDNKAKRIVEAKTVLGKDAPSRARQVIRSGDVIVSTTRPNLSAVALVPSDLDDQICSTGFCALRAAPDLDSDYLFALVQNTDFVESLSEWAKGALYPAVTDKQVRDQFVPLPPLPEQKRIAGILQEQMAAVVRARLSAEAQLKAAENLPAACLCIAFNSDEAQSWPRKRMGDITSERLIGLVRSTFEQGPSARHPYLKMENITTDGRLVFATVARVNATDAERGRYSLRKGDFLFNTRNSFELVGKTGVFDLDESDWVFNNNLMRIRFKPDIDSYFVLMAFHSDEVVTKMESLKSNTTSVCAIYDRQFVDIQIPVPPFADQRRIATQLSSQMASAERLRRTLADQLEAINQLPGALLREAFSGML